jgi:hypothetical protein
LSPGRSGARSQLRIEERELEAGGLT